MSFSGKVAQGYVEGAKFFVIIKYFPGSIEFLPLDQACLEHFIEDAENNDNTERR